MNSQAKTILIKKIVKAKVLSGRLRIRFEKATLRDIAV